MSRVGHKDDLIEARFNSDESVLLTAGADGKVFMWDWNLGEQVGVVARESCCIRSLDSADDLKRLLTACTDGSVGIWDTTKRIKLGTMKPDQEWKKNPEQHSNHGEIMCTSFIYLFCFLHLTSQPIWKTNFTHEFSGWVDSQRFHTGSLNMLKLSPNGNYMATASNDCTVKLWSMLSLRRHTDTVLHYQEQTAMRPNHLVPFEDDTPDSNGEERPLGTGFEGKLLSTLRHQGVCSHCIFSHDSELVIVASLDATVHVWTTETAQQVFVVNLPFAVEDMCLQWTQSQMNDFFAQQQHNIDTYLISHNNHVPAEGLPLSHFYGSLFMKIQNRVVVMDLLLNEKWHPQPSTSYSAPSSYHSSAPRVKDSATEKYPQMVAVAAHDTGGESNPSKPLIPGEWPPPAPPSKKIRAKTGLPGRQPEAARGLLAPQFMQYLLSKSYGVNERQLYKNMVSKIYHHAELHLVLQVTFSTHTLIRPIITWMSHGCSKQ